MMIMPAIQNVSLNCQNYLSNYALNPCANELTCTSKLAALAITFFATLFTGGLFVLGIAAYQWCCITDTANPAGIDNDSVSDDMPVAPMPLTPDQSNQLRSAARAGDIKTIREFLKDATMSESDRGWGVHAAAGHGHLDIVQEFLANGASIDGYRGNAVMAAAREGHFDIVRELLANGATISEASRGNAVQVAAATGRLDIVQELLANGATISKGSRGDAVQVANENGHPEIATYLAQGTESEQIT
ncbi:MAG: ankyrin repeat domain-containing protein [Chlamydiales bacterium]|nr:ankyrin repeat domain-containing protein [Chlamydiales bacterium]